MEKNRSWLSRIFGVVIEGQTYLNILYLLLAFPLGLFYFIFFVVGFSLGLPLIILWVGFLILALVAAGWWAFILFERQQATWLLGVDFPPLWRQDLSAKTTWEKIKSYAANPVTWLGLLFLLLKFPVGIVTFSVCVSLIAITFAFVTAPLTFSFLPLEIVFDWNAVWQIDTFWEAVILFWIGLLVGLLTLHILNGMAWVLARLARYLLSDPRASLSVAGAGELAPVTEAAVQPAASEPATEPEVKPVPSESPAEPEVEPDPAESHPLDDE